MKGFTSVELSRVKGVIAAYDKYREEGKEIFEQAIKDYAAEKRSTRFGAWRHKNRTDRQVLRETAGTFCFYGDVLSQVVPKENHKKLHNYCWDTDLEPYISLKALAEACDTGFVQVGEQYARFIKKYTNME